MAFRQALFPRIFRLFFPLLSSRLQVLTLLLEYERFSVGEMLISAERGRARFAVTGSTMNSPEAFVQLICAKGYPASCRDIPGGYEIILTEGK